MKYNFKAWSLLAMITAMSMFLHGCSKTEEPAAEAASAASEASGPGTSPVYNVELSPRFLPPPDSPLAAIMEGTKTTMRFSIDQPRANSVVHAAPSADILTSTSDLPLTVTLWCSFCTQHDAFIAKMVYHPADLRSNNVEFTFVPSRRQLDKKTARGEMVIAILNRKTGREYDRLHISVTVLASSSKSPVEDGAASITLPAPSQADETKSNADVSITLVEQPGTGVMIEIEPHAPEVREAIGAMVTLHPEEPTESPRRFVTGIDSAENMQKSTFSAFAALSRLSLQSADEKKNMQLDGIPVIKLESQQSLELSSDDEAAVTNLIARFGKRLYRDVFLSGRDGQVLGRVMGALENINIGRPLRINIRTGSLQLPWQLLYRQDGKPIDAKRFWGMRFSLSVRPLNGNERVTAPRAQPPGASKWVFARYANDRDPSWKPASEQAEALHRRNSNLLIAKSKKEFLRSNLAANRENVDAIFVFLHALSAQINMSLGDGQTVAMVSGKGPLLSFQANHQDDLTADEIEDLLSDLSATDVYRVRYLTAAPLVILNACETGPSTFLTPYLSLQDAMFKLGARGVVVTEVSVWVQLGHQFSMLLLDKLAKGQTASDATTAVRLQLLEELHNPLGLLYAYYGDPDANLEMPTMAQKGDL